MSVLIRGMEMPMSCDDCRFRDDAWCLALPRSEWRKAYNKAPEGERLEDCPLVEIPPHGRLIDADALMECDLGGEPYKSVMRRILRQAPTIIEAEEVNG